MRRILRISLITLIFWGGVTTAREQPSAARCVVAVDALERVFPDREPSPTRYADPIAVPLGGSAALQFVVSSSRGGTARLRTKPLRAKAGDALDATVTIRECTYWAKPRPGRIDCWIGL